MLENQVKRGQVEVCMEEITAAVVLFAKMENHSLPMVGLVVGSSVMAVAFKVPSVIVTFVRNAENRSKAAAKVDKDWAVTTATEDLVAVGQLNQTLGEAVVTLGVGLRKTRGVVAVLSN